MHGGHGVWAISRGCRTPKLLTPQQTTPWDRTRFSRWEDGTEQELNHLERPQLYLENGKPAVLFCAADIDRNHSFNVHIPLKYGGS